MERQPHDRWHAQVSLKSLLVVFTFACTCGGGAAASAAATELMGLTNGFYRSCAPAGS